jgi:hypothetical protein
MTQLLVPPRASIEAGPSRAKPMDARFIVLYDADAVRELDSLKGRKELDAVFAVVEKLRMLGPELGPPHVKSLKGEAGLLELRPRQGSSPVRPISRRVGNDYVILAFSVKPDKADFAPAVATARRRALRYRS